MTWQNWVGTAGAKLLQALRIIPKTDKQNTMTVQKPTISKIPLKENQYYTAEYAKKYIFLHHTAGGSAASSVAHWATDPQHIATPYIIDRDGTIYETYNPSMWAYHLGVKGNSQIEKTSIGIEICGYGPLKNDKTYTGKIIPKEKQAKVSFRGYDYWEAYTPEQIAALKVLLPYLIDKFKIPIQADRKDFWEYRNPATIPPGIYSHTAVRKDKTDIFPQKELVDLVYSL